MNTIRALEDSELLSITKELVQKERAVTMDILRHLQEIERRKLFADLRYPSLFEYAVHELGYSEAAAGRRIQAMRLMTELPGVAPKIESGALSLSNICQARSFFREMNKAQPEMALSREQKTEVLAQLEDKSAREGQRILLSISPAHALPRERERIVSTEHSEVNFLMSQELKASLGEIRALLGERGARLTLAELVTEMARLSKERLLEQRFGKNRVRQTTAKFGKPSSEPIPMAGNKKQIQISAPFNSDTSTTDVGEALRQRTRYISRATKHAVWRKAEGKCVRCGSTHRLQFDHIQPFALGGDSKPGNIQLLCGSCNLRRGIGTFGTPTMRRR
ncbi:MAG: HNH endonuclease [Bdellovibrionales bacterium]|nr:HNH endonuclease [Bdellovibrionales bacterium]